MRTSILRAVLVLFTCTLSLSTLWAQSPQKMNYQAVIRGSNEALVTNTPIGMKISIHQGSATGAAVYAETQTPTTNANGLVSLEIGSGTVINGDLSVIDWATGPYFIKTETDPAGGTSYTIGGTNQLLSVPFALHANEIDPNVPIGTDTGQMQYWNGTEWAIVGSGNEGDILTFISNKPTWVGETGTGTVQNPTTGEIWMDKNLGASRVATSSTDADAYGDLYQWGRLTDGHEKRTSGTTTIISTSDTPGHGKFILSPIEPSDWRSPQNDNLWQGVNGINNPCPSGYRLPTVAEWEAELASWISLDTEGAFASPLKFSTAGFRHHDDGTLRNVDSGGLYWSSDLLGSHSRSSGFSSGSAYVGADRRGFGFSVRCIRD